MGIAATLVYYGLVQVGDGLIWSGQVSPLFGVWLPNLVIGAVGLAMAFRLTRISSLGRHLDRPEETQHEEKPERVARSARSHRRALPRYVATRFLELALICFGGLLTAYLLVDLLERLDFFADYQPTAIQFLKLYAGRLPVLAARVIPMALLLATALTVSLLNARGELHGMRS
jgi:lipopolysaccharide export LptBFGC system permease protein LptF